MHKQNPDINVNRISAAPGNKSVIIGDQSYIWYPWDRFAAAYEYFSSTIHVLGWQKWLIKLDALLEHKALQSICPKRHRSVTEATEKTWSVTY